MAATKTLIVDALEDLVESQFEGFKWRLGNGVSSDIKLIPRGKLEKAERRDVVDYMVQQYGTSDAGTIAVQALHLIKHNELADQLKRKLQGVSVSGEAGADAGADAAVSSSPTAATAQTPELSFIITAESVKAPVINKAVINGPVTLNL